MNNEDYLQLKELIRHEITKATFEKLHVLATDIDRLRSSVKADSDFNTLKWEASADVIEKIRKEVEGTVEGTGFLLRLYALERDLEVIKEAGKASGSFWKDISVQVITVLVSVLLSSIGWVLVYLFKIKGLTP